MIINFLYNVLGILLNTYVSVVAKVGGVIPTWFSSGVSSIFSGGGMLSTFLPLYKRPDMTGLPATFGIVNVIGFLATLASVAVTIIAISYIIYFLLRLMPWNTEK